MSKVDDRINFIIHILATEKGASLSISELHDKLYERFLENCSRRTVERDLAELVHEGKVIPLGHYPKRFKLVPVKETEVKLTEDEVWFLHQVLKKHFSDIKAQRILSKIYSGTPL